MEQTRENPVTIENRFIKPLALILSVVNLFLIIRVTIYGLGVIGSIETTGTIFVAMGAFFFFIFGPWVFIFQAKSSRNIFFRRIRLLIALLLFLFPPIFIIFLLNRP